MDSKNNCSRFLELHRIPSTVRPSTRLTLSKPRGLVLFSEADTAPGHPASRIRPHLLLSRENDHHPPQRPQVLCSQEHAGFALLVCREQGVRWILGSWWVFPSLVPFLFTYDPDATALTCRHPVNQQGLPLTLPVLRPGFLVILRAGMGNISLAGWGGWGVGAREWRWGGTHGSVSRAPAAYPPQVFRRPLSGVFAPSASGLQGRPPTSQCPCLKGTRIPLIRGRWGALWPEPGPLLVLTGPPGSDGFEDAPGLLLGP